MDFVEELAKKLTSDDRVGWLAVYLDVSRGLSMQ